MQQLRNMNARIVLDKKVCWTTRIMNLHVSNPSVCSTHQVSQTTNCIRQDLFPLVYPCSLSLTSAWHVLGRSICWFVCLWVSLKEKAVGSSWDGLTKCILTWNKCTHKVCRWTHPQIRYRFFVNLHRRKLTWATEVIGYVNGLPFLNVGLVYTFSSQEVWQAVEDIRDGITTWSLAWTIALIRFVKPCISNTLEHYNQMSTNSRMLLEIKSECKQCMKSESSMMHAFFIRRNHLLIAQT